MEKEVGREGGKEGGQKRKIRRGEEGGGEERSGMKGEEGGQKSLELSSLFILIFCHCFKWVIVSSFNVKHNMIEHILSTIIALQGQ